MSAKACKYSCGTMITWDTAKSIFVEPDGTAHTKDRCASLKVPQVNASAASQLAGDPMHELAAAIRELAAAIRSRPA
jgi:hypothetical protein